MKPFRKNLFLAVTTSLSLIVESSSVEATYYPDNPADCPLSSGISPSVSLTKYMITEQINIQFNEEVCYCLNNYFSAPEGDFLSYNLTLCDEAWNPIPGWTVNTTNWIRQVNKPAYITFVPTSINNIALYYFKVFATNGTDTASDKFKINVYQLDDGQQIDYAAYWISISAMIIAAAPYIYKIYQQWGTIWSTVKEFANKNRVPFGALLGGGAGLIGGWIGHHAIC